MAFYLIDRAVRFVRGRRKCDVEAVASTTQRGAERYCRVDISVDQGDPNGVLGRFIFVRVGSVSMLQWHPVSPMAWRKGSRCGYTVTFKVMGSDSWTARLAEQAARSADGRDVTSVKLDGLYGLRPWGKDPPAG